ncbi:hypothetical protein BDP27DRAFT_1425619 [Rhodocollybia butyracea]|uniref:T6SS Phospholipase effector Tle1-like catalytic domain-containing protein n=1 Tax=Rhodocollybia butyracea TaxID=206335 RepID=A0A9P5PJS3_9AGAR|nr:hypothetical protein BDP27DRAFT_1425619 [Rhodocollybia butyracea]
MAIAWNFERIDLSAYQWLSENYEAGDRIFLFGFSRGAYQVRVIAGMIEKADSVIEYDPPQLAYHINRLDFLHKGNNDQIPFAYELYLATVTERETKTQAMNGNLNNGSRYSQKNSYIKIQDAEDPQLLAQNFKKTLSCQDVKVHFVGTWETVSSVGFARGPTLPETTTGMGHVTVFRHALALDERRVKFLPEYVNGGLGPATKIDSKKGDVKEVWFAGSHSDIGGGNIYNPMSNQFGPAFLHWMTYEALCHHLKMHPFRDEWKSIQLAESLKGFWKLFEVIPFRRLTYKDQNQTTRWPHLGSPRLIQTGQLIHKSAFKKDYVPKAKLLDGVVWNENYLKNQKLIEKDPYLSADTLMSSINDIKEPALRKITKTQKHKGCLSVISVI